VIGISLPPIAGVAVVAVGVVDVDDAVEPDELTTVDVNGAGIVGVVAIGVGEDVDVDVDVEDDEEEVREELTAGMFTANNGDE
jgi:hypothetical protein